MISFKHTTSIDEWAQLHPRLRELLLWLHIEWPYLEPMIITRISYPPAAGETGIHHLTPHRAADISTTKLPYDVAKALELHINASWSYNSPTDPNKRVALYHAMPGQPFHLHLQVRDETQYIVTVGAGASNTTI